MEADSIFYLEEVHFTPLNFSRSLKNTPELKNRVNYPPQLFKTGQITPLAGFDGGFGGGPHMSAYGSYMSVSSLSFSLSLSISLVSLFTGNAGAALPPAAAYSRRQPARRLGRSRRPPLLPPPQLLAPARQHQRRHNGGGGSDEQHRREAGGQVRSPPHLAPCPTRLCPTPPHPLTASRAPARPNATTTALLCSRPSSTATQNQPLSGRPHVDSLGVKLPHGPVNLFVASPPPAKLRSCSSPMSAVRQSAIATHTMAITGERGAPRPRSPTAACAPSVDARQFMAARRRRCRGPVVAPP